MDPSAGNGTGEGLKVAFGEKKNLSLPHWESKQNEVLLGQRTSTRPSCKSSCSEKWPTNVNSSIFLRNIAIFLRKKYKIRQI
jgi:hypothetical protein